MLTWSVAVHAAQPVLYSERSPQDALTAVAISTGLDPDELVPIPLADLARRPPVLLGAGQMWLCSLPRPTRVQDVAAALQEAERAFATARYDEALPALDRAALALDCLQEPASVEQASRIHLLRGYILQDEGRPEELARTEYRRALGFVPQLEWTLDESYRPTFELARSEVATVPLATLAVLPPFASGVWVDGRLVSAEDGVLSMPSGTHLLQFGQALLTTLRVETAPDSHEELLVPTLLLERLDPLLSTTEGRSQLDRALLVSLGSRSVVHVVTGQQGWTIEPGADAWSPLSAVGPLPTPSRFPALTTAGGALTAAGLGSAALFWLGIHQSIDPVGLPDRPDDLARYRWSGTATLISGATAGAGALLFGFGASRELGREP